MNPLFDKDELIAFTQTLIQTPSLSQNEEKIAEVMAAEMRKLQYDEVWIDEKKNVVGKIKGTGKGPTLLFNGHLDHAGIGAMEDPFSGRIMDGGRFGCKEPVIYGRGASDMKAALAAMVYAGGAIKKLGRPLRGNFLMTAVVMEEMSYAEGLKYLLNKKGITADFAVSGEATNLNVYIGHRGKIEFKITTKGKTSHGGYPQGGINAICLMNEFINAVKERYRLPSHAFLGDATYTFIDIAASPGRLTPIVPDRCELIFDRRYFPEETEEMLAAELLNIIAEIKSKNPLFDATVELVKCSPPILTDPDEKIVSAMKEARRKIMGEEGKIGAWYFGVGCYPLKKAGIPLVGFGPANEYFAHTPEDHVPVAHLEIAANVYVQLIQDLLV